jgi:hypothetical protein
MENVTIVKFWKGLIYTIQIEHASLNTAHLIGFIACRIGTKRMPHTYYKSRIMATAVRGVERGGEGDLLIESRDNSLCRCHELLINNIAAGRAKCCYM